MGNFWEKFDKIGNKVNDIGTLLDDVNDAYATTQQGFHKVQNSKRNFDRVVQRMESGKNTKDLDMAVLYYEKTNACKKRTILFCILIILITIAVCIFI